MKGFLTLSNELDRVDTSTLPARSCALALLNVRNQCGLLTYGDPPHSLPEVILRHAQALPEGGVISPKEFLHLGSRYAVDQAMSRLVKAGA